MSTIGERIRDKRIENKMSMQELADAIGKSKGNISGYEKNTFEPSAQTIINISKLFKVSTDWLLTGEEYQNWNGNDCAQNELSNKEADLVNMYRALDERDKEDAFENIHFKYKRLKGKATSLYWEYGDESSGELAPGAADTQDKIG